MQLIDGARVLTVSALIKAHVGRGAQFKIHHGGLLNLCQFYVIARRLFVSRQPLLDAEGNKVRNSHGGIVMHTLDTEERLLLMARLLDCLEHDYAACYGSDGEPFPGGCEKEMQKIIDEARMYEAAQ